MANSTKPMRLSKAAREFNVGVNTLTEFLKKKGFDENFTPNSKLKPEMVALLAGEYQPDQKIKEKANEKVFTTDRTPISIAKEEEIAEEKENPEKELIIHNTGFVAEEAKAPKETLEVEKEVKAETETSVVEKPVEKVVAANPIVPEEPKIKEPKEEVVMTKAPLAEPEVVKETPAAKPAKTEKKIPAKEENTEEKKETPSEKPKAEIAIKAEEIEKKDSPNKDKPKAEKQAPAEQNGGGPKIVDKIDLDSQNWATRPKAKSREEKRKDRQKKKDEVKHKHKEAPTKKPIPDITVENPTPGAKVPEKTQEPEIETIRVKTEKLAGPKVLGTIKLEPKREKKRQPEASSSHGRNKNKKKRPRVNKAATDAKKTDGNTYNQRRGPHSGQGGANAAKNKRKGGKPGRKPIVKHEPTEEEIQKQIKETLARLAPSGKSKASKHRRKKRDLVHKEAEAEMQKEMAELKTIQVAEYVTANDLSNMIDIPVTQIISTCMGIGLFVSINQRLDAETIVLVAEEFGFSVEFVGADATDQIVTDEDDYSEEDLIGRAPVVTVMGHVDYGKTKLLDYIRSANVVADEAGGITQHIGAYEVIRPDGRALTFLDTPGHEAFTAMRARGAKVTDIAIIVIAADDNVMPQTKEAINHAQAAGIPIVFAINKIDKPNANPDNVKNELSRMNILVEEWGGKFQSQEISALKGEGVDELLEKVLLEAEMLDLKATPKRRAVGSVIESSLDKGRGYVTKILVQDGTLRIGDMVLAGSSYGKVKAMFNERNQNLKEAGPSTPVLLLGLNSAPQAGDNFHVLKDEHEVKAIASKREQLQREQSIRTQKHITLDEIGRRLAIGDFKELNVIVKADVDGSVEALSDSLIKLSTSEIQLNVIHKSVGQISESDVLLASASDAIIVGFQVRPNIQARRLAETEGIQIKLYSIIYQAIDDLKAALEGMLAPSEEEKIVCNIEVRDVFKITKVGTIAGCMVLDGKITRNTAIRLIRDGVVVFSGKLASLKRYKDDVKEVASGYECGLQIERFNDIKIGDIVEGYEIVEVKRHL
jgi:translation initiation factor IF-2